MFLRSRLVYSGNGSELKTSRAYIMIEVMVYLMIASLLLVSILVVFKSSLNIKASIINKIEMREIASVVEDRIRYEINNSIGITRIWGASDNNIDYKNIRKMEYRAYGKLQKEVAYTKYISVEGGNIYVCYSDNKGKYQIGRHIEGMNISEKEDYVKFNIRFKIDKNSYTKDFIVLKKI